MKSDDSDSTYESQWTPREYDKMEQPALARQRDRQTDGGMVRRGKPSLASGAIECDLCSCISDAAMHISPVSHTHAHA